MDHTSTKKPSNTNHDMTKATAPANSASPAYSQNTADSIKPIDKVCFVSDDGQIVIRQKVKTAQKHPPSDYPCIVIESRALVPHSRVRRLPDGGLELMLTYEECENLITYLNEAAKMAGKGELYQILQRVPPKTRAHKEKWKRRNEERLGLRPKMDWWRNQRRHRPGHN